MLHRDVLHLSALTTCLLKASEKPITLKSTLNTLNETSPFENYNFLFVLSCSLFLALCSSLYFHRVSLLPGCSRAGRLVPISYSFFDLEVNMVKPPVNQQMFANMCLRNDTL